MKSISAEQPVSAQLLACLLAGALIVVVAGLNMFDSGVTQIGYEEFQRLLKHGLVKRITLAEQHLNVQLDRAVRFEGLRDRPVAARLLVETEGPPTDDDVEAWRKGGVDIVDAGPTSSQLGRPVFLGRAAVGLMGGGVWYLIAQARADRRRPGPRQRLRDAEADYRAGRMTQEEYEKEADCISAEL